MTNIAIKVENLSKAYQLGEIGTGTISRDLERWWARMRGNPDPFLKIGQANDRTSKAEKGEVVWSLKDINFEIEQGQAVGIIGRNGAGKSTLLKILSRVTSPTTGSVKIKGRVASLLEVGTGFHPELTGRENIFLNGAILGMRKAEIKHKFDEIVDFAGVEKYIDTPVKRYSSGMYVRLAFAVAAHLESEILIVDEVLAVGDAEFQKKCLGKMGDVSSKEGRTVLFVSHNMGAVKGLCSKGMLLTKGELQYYENVEVIISNYFKAGNKSENTRIFGSEYKNEIFELRQLTLKAINKTDVYDVLDEFDEIHLITDINLIKEDAKYDITYVLKGENGDPIFTFSHKNGNNQYLKKGANNIVCKFPKGYFNIGNYYLSFYMIKDSRESIFVEHDILNFDIKIGKREIGQWLGKEPGLIKPIFEWEMK